MLGTILIIYGILCVAIGLLKPPFIWKMKKFEVMKKMFGGEMGLQLFVLAWGAAAIIVGVII